MELVFITGSSIRKVFINDRKVSLISAELGFTPLEIDLDKLNEFEDKIKKIKMSKEDIKTIKDLAKLGSEKEIAKDIIKDFQKSGWRCTKRNGNP